MYYWKKHAAGRNAAERLREHHYRPEGILTVDHQEGNPGRKTTQIWSVIIATRKATSRRIVGPKVADAKARDRRAGKGHTDQDAQTRHEKIIIVSMTSRTMPTPQQIQYLQSTTGYWTQEPHHTFVQYEKHSLITNLS